MKYYISPSTFNIYAPKANEWHCATYEQEGEFFKMTGIFSTSIPVDVQVGMQEVDEKTYKLLFKYCKNLLPKHEEVPDIRPAA